ncbi:hypothetical protein [Aliivibrio sp. SR45-2]|uniref:hypothetical protein n=1 Tax=Aliivibrio sp. SR45-2 TaxID=2760931 RepID=UPI0015FE10F0|nr:hypothetical protein [Aliivibrio sp. SR45-2]MBB1315955.1 hypothetical protein [Aliivibrio sp. SR45-2]
MNEFWKGVLFGLLPTIIMAILSSLFFDIFIDKVILPGVVKQLENQNYVSHDLKEGKFVSTNLDSFNTNHMIDSSILLNLKDGEFVLTKKLESVEENNNERLDKVVKDYKQAIFSQSEEIAFTRSDVDKLKKVITVLDAKLNEGFQVKVYYHHNREYKGQIQLNTNNILIKKLLIHGSEYQLNHASNYADFDAVLRPLSVDGKLSFEPIASLYIDDHNKLFDDAKSSGVGDAQLRW